MTSRFAGRPQDVVGLAARWPRQLKVACGSLALIAGVLAALDGGATAVTAVIVSVVIVLLVARAVAHPLDESFVVGLATLAILARDALTAGIDRGLAAFAGTHVFAPDEGIYLALAAKVAAHWHDPTMFVDPGDPYISSQWVLTIARIFYVVGPVALVPKLLNTLFAVLAGLLTYRTMVNLGMSGKRWALLLILVFPSIVLWSSLALKDTYVLFFVTAAVWSSSEYIRSRNHWWHFVTLASLLPIESVRRYIFFIVAFAWVFVVLGVSGRERLRAAAVILTTVLALAILIDPLAGLGVNPLYVPILVRQTSAVGARTSFVEPPPVARLEPGEEVIVSVPGLSPSPGSTARVFQIHPGTQIVVEGTNATPGPGPTIVVRPGDILVMATPTPTATPIAATESPAPSTAASRNPSARVVVFQPEAKNVVSTPLEKDTDANSFSGSLAANARQLPIGLLFVVAAPFPWTARSVLDLATIPEMILWYICLVFALLGGILLIRRRNFRFGHGVAAIVGMTITFALIQGNVGTLLRSRAMIIPFVLVLTAVGIDAALRNWPAAAPIWVQRLMRDGS